MHLLCGRVPIFLSQSDADTDTQSALRLRPATIEPAFGQIALPDADVEAALTNPLVLARGHERAIAEITTVMRVDPVYPVLAPYWLAYHMLGQYARALPLLRESVATAPKFFSGHLGLAATCTQLGNCEEARREAAEALKLEPTFTIDLTGGTNERMTVAYVGLRTGWGSGEVSCHSNCRIKGGYACSCAIARHRAEA